VNPEPKKAVDMENLGCELMLRTDSPILVLTPHTGRRVPAELLEHEAWVPIEGRINDPAGLILQTAARQAGASLIAARYNPCFVDFNVPADNRSLEPGFGHLRVCRTYTARNEALYEAGSELSQNEIEARVEAYWRPFHALVAAEVQRLRRMHHNVLLLVSHASWWLSPFRLQPGALDCNIGTAMGKACDARLVGALTRTVQANGRSWVVNGQIADAFSARHYGKPADGIHAIEVEVAGRWRSDCATQCASDQGNGGSQTSTDSLALMVDILRSLEATLRDLPARPAYESMLETAAQHSPQRRTHPDSTGVHNSRR
jgi:N-formylglutamate deformylase